MDQSSIRGRLRGTWAAVLLVAAPILVLFGPVLLGDRSLAMRDAAHFYHPLLEWTCNRWPAGGPPLWNPYENTGLPLLADASSSLFYPGRLLLALPFEFTWRYKLYVVGHVVLAAFGAYLLARHWQASIPAAAAAAIAYSCGGVVVFQHANVVFLVGAAWLPFAAWAIDRMLVNRSWLAALTLGGVLALMVLGGDPQMAYHALLMAIIYAAVSLFRPDASAGETPAPPIDRRLSLARRVCGHLTRIGLAAACGFALAAVQILPSTEAAATSDRSYYQCPRNIYEAAGYLARREGNDDNALAGVAKGLFGQPEATTHHERTYEFSVPPWRLIELIWPNIGGRMFPIHHRWMSLVPAEGRIWTPTLYLGLLPLLLALGQWRFRRSDPVCVWLSWLLLLFTLGSFGWYGLGWCAREVYATSLAGNPDDVPIGSPVGGLYWLLVTFLPAYVKFRYPAKLLVVAALAASQLAARGWDRSLSTPSPRLLTCLKILAVMSLGLLVACWLGFSWLDHAIDAGQPLGKQISAWLTRQADASLGPFDLLGSQRDVYLALLQAVVVCVAAHWLCKRLWHDDRATWQWGMLALVAIDVALANYWLVPTAPADIWRRSPSAIEAMGASGPVPSLALGDAPRVYRASLMRWRPASFSVSGKNDRLSRIAAWERDSLFPKYGLNHGISLVESYGSLKPVDWESFFAVAKSYGPRVAEARASEMPHPAALRLLATHFLILPRGWQPALANEPLFATPVAFPPGVPRPEGAALWRMVDALPRAWIVHRAMKMPPLTGRSLAAVDERTRDVLFPLAEEGDQRRPRDFGSSAVVETDLPLTLPQVADSQAREVCRITEYQPQRVEIDVTLASPGLVILSDAYAPGWTATVETDGTTRTVDILRTNRICRGILLPAGEHRITYAYRPLSFRYGAWMSGAAWAALSIICLCRVASKRKLMHRDE
ncbi:MAG TPA: hypothetical protein VFB96_01880 [Pirellulaceae bacterium]|nr:hypothetical protein [Pirellulaceae bacterium]